MGITRNQLRKLGFKKDSVCLEYTFPKDPTKSFVIYKGQNYIIVKESLSDHTIISPVVMLDGTGYFEMQRVLQDLAIGLHYEFENQLGYSRA